jgi:hypothetical protein
MASSRKLAIWGYASAAIAGSLAIVVGAFALLIAHHPGPPAPESAWVLTAAYGVAIVWAVVFIALYWRRLDEAAKEAQKFAWFYGSIGATVLSAPIIVQVRLTGDHFLASVLPHAMSGPAALLTLGWMALLLAQGAGFCLVWAGWWWAKR